MHPHTPAVKPQEIELKLYLPTSDLLGLAKRLAKSAVLVRRRPSRQVLHNIYFDTPDQKLRQKRVALRLRRVGETSQTHWLQTLKTSPNDPSALSRRGEWESQVAGATLSREALDATPWSEFDTDGSLFDALIPCFVTTFERTLWLVHRRDGSLIEVALDIGHIEARGKRTSICELELELKAGEPTALFEVAQQIARTVAVLPANLSKAQRGFLLAQDGLDQPERSQAPRLTFDLTRPALAQRVLREMFTQFTGNLNALRTSDDPEVVHQARVGWRRFKSGVRLFNKMFKENPPPSWLELRPLLDCLGELRNLDVARDETLPPLANAYVMGDDQRANDWQALTQSLEQTAKQQRKAVRYALQEPVVGMSLLATSQWLENLSDGDENKQIPKDKLRHWAKSRILRMHQQMEAAHQSAATPEGFHRARILAKRLRYGTEALRDLLPKQLAKYCHQQSCSLQSSIGSTRDITQASELVARLEVDRGVVEFFRGVALGAVLSSALMTPAKHMTP